MESEVCRDRRKAPAHVVRVQFTVDCFDTGQGEVFGIHITLYHSVDIIRRSIEKTTLSLEPKLLEHLLEELGFF